MSRARLGATIEHEASMSYKVFGLSPLYASVPRFLWEGAEKIP